MGITFDDDFENLLVKPLEKQREKIEEIEEDNLLTGYWSSDKEGKIPITKANLDELVYFQVRTSKKFEGKEIKLKLFEDDGSFRKPDEKFPAISKDKKSIIKKEFIKSVVIKNQKSFVEISLSGIWDSVIDKDFGFEIELYWVVYEKDFLFLGERLYSTLDVGFSKKHLFLKPAYISYSLPDMLTEQGENIIFSIGNFANEELKNQLVEIAGEQLDKYRYFLGARILKSGKVATNIGEVFLSKKAIYTYDIHTNSGKEVKLMQAANFGFKNKYVNNGKLVTTKGISQIDYFTNVGLKNNILKAGKELTQIWDIFDLAKVFFNDDYTNIPTGYLANPVSFAFALLNEAVIKPTIQGIKDDWNKGLEEDFEIIHKPKGLKACKAFVDNRNINSPLEYLDIFTPTLQKLLKNEFLNYDELYQFNEKERFSASKGKTYSINHTIFYNAEKNKYGLNDDIYINCIFINNTLMNY